MKRISVIAIVLVLVAGKAVTDPQVGAPAGNPLTMTGSAQRLVPNPSTAPPMMCSSILIQPMVGSANVVYVLNAPPGITMALNGAGTTTVAQLAPGTSIAPGQSFTYPSNGSATRDQGGTDLRYWGVEGTSPDQVIATCALQPQ